MVLREMKHSIRKNLDSSDLKALSGSPQCSNCKALCYESDRFCALCGEHIQHHNIDSLRKDVLNKVTNECGRCGSKNNHPIAFFCQVCGEKFTENT